jgi:hypothetical protein
VYYPLSYTSVPKDLVIPQDAAARSYIVNTELTFKLDSSALPLFPEEIPLYEFIWDFGDGITGTGQVLNHLYTTPGSKVVIIKTRDTRTKDEPQLLSTLYVNILPVAGYQLPAPRIRVNGVTAADATTSTLNADFSKRVTLELAETPGSGTITSVLWDLGNEQLSRDKKVTVDYKTLYSSVQPIVRVTDSNGLFVDATIQLENATISDTLNPVTTTKPPRVSWILGAVAGGVAASAVLYLWLRRRSSLK